MTPLEVLAEARALIAEPEHWTQGTGARDSNGLAVNAAHPAACSFCAMGAIDKVVGVRRALLREECWALFVGQIEGRAVVTFNDTPGRTHAEVLAAFDAAIEKADR